MAKADTIKVLEPGIRYVRMYCPNWLTIDVKDVGVSSECNSYAWTIGSYGGVTFRDINRQFIVDLISGLQEVLSKMPTEENKGEEND